MCKRTSLQKWLVMIAFLWATQYSMGPEAEAGISEANLIGWWKFDEGSGETAYDSSGHNHGTVYGAEWSTGQIDGALSFDGSGDYVHVQDDDTLDFHNAISIVAWIKVNGWNTTAPLDRQADVIVRKNGAYILYRYRSNLDFYLYGPNHRLSYPILNISLGTWYHVVATYDRENMKMYIDGLEVSSEPQTANISITTSNLAIGAKSDGIGKYFNGIMDDIQLFDRALSAGEIREFYESGLADVVELHLTGPQEVGRNSQGQYNAIAHYGDGSTREVTAWTTWSIEPDTYAVIDNNGVLTTRNVNEPQTIAICGQYTLHDVNVEAEMIVEVLPPRILHVPEDYDTIQAAVDATLDGDEVVVADGIYTGTGNMNLDFGGRSITVRSQNGPDATVIDCENNGRGFHFHNNENDRSILDGFTITNGRARKGGAIACSSSSPTIKNCIIKTSYGREDGGGMYNFKSSPILSNCKFLDNYAYYWYGGGIYNFNGSAPRISNCTFSGNRATWGGGIYNANNSSPIIAYCTFSDNYAGQLGGGIGNSYSSPLVEKCIFSINSVGDGGGGIYVGYGSVPKIRSCIFSHNRAGRGGGIGNFSGFDFSISNCTFFANIARNTIGGGFIYNHRPLSRVENCIIWKNSEPEMTGVDSMLTFSCIKGGWTGIGNIDADPVFADPCNCDYHLLRGSPCLDAGDPNYIPEPNETDFDSNPRVMGDRIDIGAYESIPIFPEIDIEPARLNFSSRGKWITCHIWLPEGYDVADVNCSSIMLEETILAKVVEKNNRQRSLIVKFSRPALKDLLLEIGMLGDIELLVTGKLADRTFFEGTDVVNVFDKAGTFVPKASNPEPADKKTYVDPNGVLSWTPGYKITSHELYLGTDYNDVNDATVDSYTFIGELDINNFNLSGLRLDITYYWRIDEVGAKCKTKGDIWSFTTGDFTADPNLVGWWKLDEPNGTIAYDSVGINHGTLNGNPMWCAGRIGGALDFDGTGDYVQIPHSNNLTLISQGTVATWVNLDCTDPRGIVTKNANIWWDGNYALMVGSEQAMIFVLLNGNWDRKVVARDPQVTPTNQWVFYVGVFDDSTAKLYKNGTEVASVANTITPKATTASLNIGHWGYKPDRFVDGKIDDIKIYNQALDAHEIKGLYNAGLN